MTVEALFGTLVMNKLQTTPREALPAGLIGGRVRALVDTVEVTAGASTGSTYVLARVPAAAYPLPASRLHWDDMAASGSPVLQVGLVGSQITDDPDAFRTGLDASSAGIGVGLLSSVTLAGRAFWQFAANTTVNPGGELDLVVTLGGDPALAGGSLSLELYYALD